MMSNSFLGNKMFAVLLLVCGWTCFEAGEASAQEKEAPGKLPETIKVSCAVKYYGFQPVRKSWNIQQFPAAVRKYDVQLKRSDPGRSGAPSGGFRPNIPAWKGSRTIDLKAGYKLRIDAHFLIRKPMADFVGNPSGLAVDVSCFYMDKLIGFETTGVWSESKTLSMSAELEDTTYIALMNENSFAIPSQFSGYGEGFRYWAAVRDGLKGGDTGLNFETLNAALEPLGRKQNLMIPYVSVACSISRPKGTGIPPADTPPVLKLKR